MKNKDFSMFFLFKNLLIFVKIPMDFEILFFMYLIWSDQFNLLSIITPKNLVLLTFTKFFPTTLIGTDMTYHFSVDVPLRI